ncbi:hypothetical protein [Caldibacillus debilis]|uniref:hypothetical protein n=1 Tax=Caldibacillus debilis TaxID=301148 RepID=UPI0023EF7641|nr:hypothetical protein [Caldibacillus debilis]
MNFGVGQFFLDNQHSGSDVGQSVFLSKINVEHFCHDVGHIEWLNEFFPKMLNVFPQMLNDPAAMKEPDVGQGRRMLVKSMWILKLNGTEIVEKRCFSSTPQTRPENFPPIGAIFPPGLRQKPVRLPIHVFLVSL